MSSSLSRRNFLATSLAAAAAPLTTEHLSIHLDGRFFSQSEHDDLRDGCFPIPLDRLVILNDSREVLALASQLADFYCQSNCSEAWTRRILSGRAVCLIVPDIDVHHWDWWLVVGRSEESFRPIVMHFTSRDRLEECSVTGLLMARITFRLHRQRKRIRQLPTDLPQLLRLVNRQIIEATKGLPE